MSDDYPRTGDVVSLRDAIAGAQEITADDEMVTSRCADCGTRLDVPRWIRDMAVAFHKRLTARGEQGLQGAGRCGVCGHAWEIEQQAIAERRHANHLRIWVTLRTTLASYRAGDADDGRMRQALSELPDDFTSAHAAALKEFREKCNAVRLTRRRREEQAPASLELE